MTIGNQFLFPETQDQIEHHSASSDILEGQTFNILTSHKLFVGAFRSSWNTINRKESMLKGNTHRILQYAQRSKIQYKTQLLIIAH